MRARGLYRLAFAVFFGWRSPATSPRQLARSAAGDCQFSPTEPVKPTKRAQFALYLVVHAHMPLRDRMRSTTSTGTESRGHQSTPDHGGVPPCCLPVIRRNVPADAARSHIHMQDSSRDGKQRSNLPISDRLRRWISARNGRPRSDHDRVVMGRLSLAVRLPQFQMIQRHAIEVHVEQERDFGTRSTRCGTRHGVSGWHMG